MVYISCLFYYIFQYYIHNIEKNVLTPYVLYVHICGKVFDSRLIEKAL